MCGRLKSYVNQQNQTLLVEGREMPEYLHAFLNDFARFWITWYYFLNKTRHYWWKEEKCRSIRTPLLSTIESCINLPFSRCIDFFPHIFSSTFVCVLRWSSAWIYLAPGLLDWILFQLFFIYCCLCCTTEFCINLPFRRSIVGLFWQTCVDLLNLMSFFSPPFQPPKEAYSSVKRGLH